MPAFDNVKLEFFDNGALDIDKLPEDAKKALQGELDRMFGKGAAKAAEEAKQQLEKEIQRVRDDAKKHGADPALTEKLKNLELELSQRKEAEALRDKNYEEAQKLREERHGKELSEREEKLKALQVDLDRRTARMRELATSEIRVAALTHGAREESVDELEMLLGRRVGLGDDLKPFVADAADPQKVAVGKDGQPLTIDGLVEEYLAAHPHHKAAPAGRGGGAPGGRSLAGQGGKPPTEFEQAVEALAKHPSTDQLARAMRSLPTSQGAA